MMAERRLPKVGVGVIIRRDRKVLIGQRLNAHGHESWSFPGGHLEYGESFEDCAKRETREETGLEINLVGSTYVTNDNFEIEGKHYVTVFVVGDWIGGEAKVKEPDKIHRWQWIGWDKLPQPMFLPLQHLVESGYSPFDDGN